MRRFLCLGIVLAFPPFLAGQTVNVSVIGVVVKHPAKERVANVPVGLYCNRNMGCSAQRVPGKTGHVPVLGLYHLTKFQTSSTEVYVLYERQPSDHFFADPVEVEITCKKEEHCVLLAADLELKPITAAKQEAGVVAVIRADWAAQSIRVKAGLISKEEGAKQVEETAARIIGLTHWTKSSNERLERIFRELKKKPWPLKIGELKVFDGADDFMKKVKGNPLFEKTRNILPRAEDLLKKEPLSPDEFHKWLLLPEARIPLDWMTHPAHLDTLRSGLKKAPINKRPVVGVFDGKGLPLDDLLSRKALVHLLGTQPEMREFALIEVLKTNSSLTEDQRRFLDDGSLFPGPLVLTPGK